MSEHSGRTTRVLVIDDAPERSGVRQGLETDPEVEVVGVAASAHEAKTMLLALRPDVVTLDLELPGVHGLALLEKLMSAIPVPTVLVATAVNDASIRALQLGAVAVVTKQADPEAFERFAAELRSAVWAAARRGPVEVAGGTIDPEGERVIALGAGTGGRRTLEHVLRPLGLDTPPVLVVQHLPLGRTAQLAWELDHVLAVRVREAAQGDRLEPGLVLLAPGGAHMTLGADGEVNLRHGPRVHLQRPSIDVMFTSVAKAVGARAVGVLLTGTGCDGAQGLERLRDIGARTIAQSESSCPAFDMPRAAIERGAAMQVVAAPEIGMLLAADVGVRQPAGRLSRSRAS